MSRPASCFLAAEILTILVLACQRPEPPPEAPLGKRLSEALSEREVSNGDLPDRAIPLEPGIAVTNELAADRWQTYSVRLAKDQFLGLEVSQDEVDVEIAIRSPEGSDFFAVDSPSGTEEPESLWLVAEVPGEYLVTVRPIPDSASGKYALLMSEDPRPATAADRHRAAALRSFVRAEGRRGGSPEEKAQATTAYAEARKHWRQLGPPPGALVVWRRSLWLLNDLGEIGRAVELCDEVREVFRIDEPRRETGRINYECGSAYRLHGSLEQAQELHQQALRLAREVDHRHGQAKALQGLALVANSRGELDRALSFFRQAQEIFDHLGRADSAASVLHNIGKLLIQLDEPEAALDHLQRALDVRLELGSPVGGTLTQTGFALTRIDRLDEAVAILENALDRQREAGSERGAAVTLDHLGRLLFELGNQPAALERYRQALRIFERLDNLGSVANTRLNVGLVLLELGRIDPAAASLGAARALLDEVEDSNAEAHVEAALARTARRRGDPEAALRHLDNALGIIESVRRTVPGPSLRASHFATWQDFYHLYVDLSMELHQRSPTAGFAALAFYASERARARSLLDLLATRTDGGAGPGSAVERNLRAQIASAKLRLSGLPRDAPSADSEKIERQLRRLLLDYRMERAENDVHIAAAEPVTGSPKPLRLEEVQQLLDEDTLLLSYVLGEERSFLWLVGAGSFEVVELGRRGKIERVADHVHRLLRESHNPQTQGMIELATEELTELVLAPAADLIEARRLVVIGDGKLRYVPLAVLPHPAAPHSSPPRLLLHEHEIVHLPSASALAWLRARRTRWTAAPHGDRLRRRLTLIGDPVFDAADERVIGGAKETPPVQGGPRLARLWSSRLELEAVRELAAAGSATVFSGFDANKDEVLRNLRAPSGILHFATHSLLDDQIPELSAIVLSQVDEGGAARDGMLYLYEIFGLRLPADLVVLSACETAGGQPVLGEGLVGMTHGFLAAGAARVLASLWRVEDRATAELMREFYRGLFEGGLTPAAALRTAQLKLLENGRRRAPYYWAGFILQGEWL
ncbi:MAG: CHAT domain-containing tetratricopeptide repeat protein [Thermoanaerobaculia bacterium]